MGAYAVGKVAAGPQGGGQAPDVVSAYRLFVPLSCQLFPFGRFLICGSLYAWARVISTGRVMQAPRGAEATALSPTPGKPG